MFLKNCVTNTMMSKSISTQVNVSQCSQCLGDTEYHCRTCRQNLCPLCKWKHNLRLNTKHHYVVLYKYRHDVFFKHEMCVVHPDQVYDMHCEPCGLPICFFCEEQHKTHRVQSLKVAYKKKQKETASAITYIRSENLYHAQLLRSTINSDFKTIRNKVVMHQTSLVKLHITQKDLNTVLQEAYRKTNNWLIQKKRREELKLYRHIAKIQIYEKRNERIFNRPLQFLRFIHSDFFYGRDRLWWMRVAPFLSYYRFSFTQDINMVDLIELLVKFKFTLSRKQRKPGKEHLLTLMPSPELQNALSVTGVYECDHISCVKQNEIWVSGYNQLILHDISTGNKLCHVDDLLQNSRTGLHAVNPNRELIYIDKDYNINKLSLSDDLKILTVFIKNTSSTWKPQCVFCSPSTGDILVAMSRYDGEVCAGIVMRYSDIGLLTQKIPHTNTQHLYKWPVYITSNHNGDVVVSDWDCGVVVTSQDGIHRYTYKGPVSGSELCPAGICTDALSHILVCDTNTDTIQMINKDGKFLSYLLTKDTPGIHCCGVQSLSYFDEILWVGFMNNNLSAYVYLDRTFDITGKAHYFSIKVQL